MAEATFSLAVESLSHLLIQKRNILRGVEDEVKPLIYELQRMKYFLRNAVIIAATDPTISDWISQLRELAQDAEDAVVISISKVETQPLSKEEHLRKLGKKIRSIGSCLKGITKSNLPFLSQGSTSSSRISSLEVERDNEHVFGLDEDVPLLVERAISDERRGLSVAVIVGVGGIGKTTLARKVFFDHMTRCHFQCTCWVVVGEASSPMEIMTRLLSLIQDPPPPAGDTLTQRRLGELMREYLRYPYFIVLDDLWDVAQFEFLARVLPEEVQGRVLITTRNRDITRHARFVHEMRTLGSPDCWELFSRIVFNRSNPPEHLQDIGRQILQKCHGLPLAIKKVGSLLVGRELAREWEETLQTMDLTVMSEPFESTYHKLSPELKLCFLCMGFFKEGATIRAEKLVQVWIAGGMFLKHKQTNTTVDEIIARSYLDALIHRDMVQIEDKTKDEKVKNCRIYNIFHKPSIRKAEEEISFEILREEGDSRPIDKPRHRSVYCSREIFLYSINQDSYLRSLFFHGGGNFDGRLSYWENFELLRILDFEGFGLQEFPGAITELTGLRYLGLRNNYIRQLPHSLARLKKLKVLDIALNFGLVVPDVICEMKSLRHLYMSEIICSGPLTIDMLKSLQTLTFISMNNWTYNRSSLQMMTSLRKLGIEELNEDSDVSRLFMSLAHLENLVCLNLRGSRFRRMPSLDEVGYLNCLTHLKLDGLLAMLPSAENFPPNLCYFSLVNTSLNEDPMPILEELPKLLYLKLRNAYVGDRMVISRFFNLKVLRIGELWHLKNIKVEDYAMPILRHFEINSCPYLENVPRRAIIID